MSSKDIIYEDLYKTIYPSDKDKKWVVELKEPEDDAFKTKKRGKTTYSSINADMASKLFQYLNSFHVPNNFDSFLDKNKYLSRSVEIIPIRITVYNAGTEHLVADYGAEKNVELSSPILEFFKSDAKEKLFVNEYHAMAFEMATIDEFRLMSRMATKINAILKSYFSRRELQLVRFSCEFGRENGKLIMTGPIDMNTSAFINPNVKPEKDPYSRANVMLEKAYNDIQQRLQS
jgi:phosphoribosylaminoimidazole-succinocarboxamide synthase